MQTSSLFVISALLIGVAYLLSREEWLAVCAIFFVLLGIYQAIKEVQP